MILNLIINKGNIVKSSIFAPQNEYKTYGSTKTGE
jgi:hypothetical protein